MPWSPTRCPRELTTTRRHTLARAALVPLLLGGACVPFRGYRRYEPAPLAPPAARTAAFAARRLDDPALQRFLATAGAAAPAARPAGGDSTWRPRALGLAAVFFNPALDTARAGLGTARAAELTAGQRPEPTAGYSVGSSGPVGAGAFVQALTTGVTFETAGKRPARRALAQAAALATALRLRATGWRVALDAEDAATQAWGADLTAADARTEHRDVAAVLTLLRARYAEGSTSLAEVARAEADVQAAVVATALAERARADARDTLARALGVPVAAARAIRLAPPGSGCAALDTFGARPLQALALQRRADLGAALADYTATEADVRLQVARQYPDLVLGPGLVFQQGALRWTAGLGLSALGVTRNRGPLAEAAARRLAAAARVEQVQQQVLSELDAARLECAGAAGQLAAADSLAVAAARNARLAQAAYVRGENGRTEVALARLTAFRAARARRAAQLRGALAGPRLDRALGGWLSGPTLSDGALLTPPRPVRPAPESSR